jgi:hypothetical protein
MKQPKKQRHYAKPERRIADDASLYPLDLEDAIRAILEAGPHPKDDTPANRRQPNSKRPKTKT